MPLAGVLVGVSLTGTPLDPVLVEDPVEGVLVAEPAGVEAPAVEPAGVLVETVPAAEGVVVLYGTVFDEKDRVMAEQTANGVLGVNSVVDNLRTKTGKWAQEEERINTQLLTNGFNDVQARVVGPYIYLSGNVVGPAAKDRAANVAASVYPNKQINNMIFVQPGSLF